jgi:glycosyltransferase involved in cell wall biosynthesis
MKMLMVSHYFESHRGGVELISGRLVRELIRLGQNVVWLSAAITPPPCDREIKGRTTAVRASNFIERYFGIPFPLLSPSAIWRLGREVRSADIILLQESLYPICIAAFLFARLYSKRVVITQHVGIVPYNNPLIRSLMSIANRFIARPMLAHADCVAFFSEITARYFSGMALRAEPELIFTGVDTNIFHPIKRDGRSEVRRSLLKSDRPIVLFVGRFVEKKGLHILARMARSRPDIQWVFAGWGHLNPEDWGLPNVTVFRDLSGLSLASLYQASDVFVLPSKGEGFPLVIQEALACGLPVVCSEETAGADSAVTPFLSAVPLDEGEPEITAAAFCTAIDMAMAANVENAGLSDERFRFVSARYSWSACAVRYLEIIMSLQKKAIPNDCSLPANGETVARCMPTDSIFEGGRQLTGLAGESLGSDRVPGTEGSKQ